uniref:Uncharacterized protein n=1 Tax=Cucumis melo TaxID=3656 RepID=A0A9I9EAY2_CUCME
MPIYRCTALITERQPPTLRALNHDVLKRLVRIGTIYSSFLIKFEPLPSSLKAQIWAFWYNLVFIILGFEIWLTDAYGEREGDFPKLRDCVSVALLMCDRQKEHARLDVSDGRRFRMWLNPWLQGGAIFEQVGKQVLYDAASRWVIRNP